MSKVIDILAKEFVCSKCKSGGATVEKLAMSGTGWSRFLDIQLYRYLFASCHHCGFTEIYNLKMLEEKGDDLGTFLDILFSG